MNKRLSNCPVCNSRLEVERYHCPNCDTAIEGQFSLSELALLSSEQQEFARIFLISGGSIKEVEKRLGISYPTVKNRLNQIISVLTHSTHHQQFNNDSYDVLEKLERGEIDVEEALEEIRKE